MVLEDVHDPHNAAAVLRTCDAFGIQKVCFIFEQEKRYSPKRVGRTTSSSASKWLDFAVYTSTRECFRDLHRQGFEIYATALSGKSHSLYKTRFKKPKVALCFGNEHRGLSETAIKLSDRVLHIPMEGFVQSLNLSVTAAICLYELARQRQAKKTTYLLPKRAQAQLYKKWSAK